MPEKLGKVTIKAESPSDSNNDLDMTVKCQIKSLKWGCFCTEPDRPYLLI